MDSRDALFAERRNSSLGRSNLTNNKTYKTFRLITDEMRTEYKKYDTHNISLLPFWPSLGLFLFYRLKMEKYRTDEQYVML